MSNTEWLGILNLYMIFIIFDDDDIHGRKEKVKFFPVSDTTRVVGLKYIPLTLYLQRGRKSI
jgi:hypothetical protein